MSATSADGRWRVLPAGDRALLVEGRDAGEAVALAGRLAREPGVVDVLPAGRTVLVSLTGAGACAAVVERVLATAAAPEPATGVPDGAEDVLVVPVVYDGADLAEAARLLGCSTGELVRRHTAGAWRCDFLGFAPGFGYLSREDDPLVLPRRSTPRTSVPAGSVALADGRSAVYPRASPGGWQLLGRTSLVLWDLDRRPPALLQPGRLVQFQAVDA
ncbi:5-oxoprolinase subunit B family protein [Auraticoccus monumenti]|uniref:Sensor histidine kinase inhibitor, KipI family n=1 Tax=Auraticoccus monumenti TaxID=675864 RepID=A0A1G7BKS8_9ACTN|nr:allophanate hydrolase subunit 1 [Auraticoccus monumenti]SDE27708.1 sensor histidine kinase inhibitor, KipI family [Auraticoccus monumenti]